MGGNISKEDVEGTVAAYTLYGFAMNRCCNPPVFLDGAPGNSCCGTSCAMIENVAPNDPAVQKALTEFESHLDEAADLAKEAGVTWCSHVFCSGVDTTAEKAAKKLNEEWCPKETNTTLSPAGLSCSARREVYGFGRTRVTYLVIRVYPRNPTV